MRADFSAVLQACRAGDSAAWSQLVRQFGRLVSSIAAKYGFEQASVDDVFQTVFLRLFSSLGDIKDSTKLSAWLITTTHRECWRIRREAARRATLEKDSSDARTQRADEPADDAERQRMLNEALSELGGRCEDLLRALYLDPSDPDYQTIAVRLGLSPNSISPTRARCLEKLERVLLSRDFFDD